MDPRHLDYMSEGTADVGRFPQWSIQETRDLLIIRAELDSGFMETKRNKLLWEVISTKMKERGHNRSAEQCKTKWKNLVTRYKGIEQEGIGQHFPFYNELQEIFTNRMQRLLSMEPRRRMEFSFDDHDDDNDNDNDNSINTEKASGSSKKRQRVESSYKLREILETFLKQQMQTETELMKMYEAREEERRMKEMEWRKRMEELEKERLRLDEQWRQRQDQRRVREEARAEKRDALITALLNKLTSS